MANTILMKSRQDDATVPGATALKVGELAVNTFDGRLFLGTDLSGSASRAAGGAATASTWIGAPILDEDNLSSDSATSLATQQSIKAYVDSNAGTGDITGVTITTDSGGGSAASDTGGSADFTIQGGEGMNVTNSGATITVAGEDATTSNKGVASFSSDNFAVSSGAVTIKDGGVVAAEIGSNAVTAAKLNNDIVSGLDDIGAAIAATDEMIVSDAGTIKRTDVSRLGTFLAGDGLSVSSGVLAVSVDDSSIETNSDAIRVKASGITNAMLAGSIAISKLAANDVTIAADSGTSHAIDLGETLTVAGTSNEVETSISNNTLTIGLPDNVTIGGNLTVSGTTTTVQNVAIGAADSIIFEGATADDFETTLTVTDPTADRTITLPNVTGTVVTTGDTGTVNATMLAANSVDSSELVDGSIDASHISSNAVTAAKLNNDIVSGLDDIGAAIAATDEMIVSDAGTIKRTDVSRLGTFLAGDGLAVSSGVLAVGVDDSSVEISSDAIRVKASGVTNAMLAGSIADSKLSTISTAGKVALSALEIDGATDIGAGLADADLFIVDDGANGTERKCAASRIPTYVAAATMTLTNTTISGGAYST